MTEIAKDVQNFIPMGAIAGERKNAGKLGKAEFRANKALEEARKNGTAPPELDTDGRVINPHIPQFISKAPWYMDDGTPSSLKHQRLKDNDERELRLRSDSYKHGDRVGSAATKYRKGACENCGAQSHAKRDCTERPRRQGAKWSGQDIQADELLQKAPTDWDSKRDPWNGYDIDNHQNESNEHRQVEFLRDLSRSVLVSDKIPGAQADQVVVSDDTELNPQKYEEKTKSNAKTLRIREDTAKYLLNLDPESQDYDPKTRSMKEPIDVDGFTRGLGDALNFEKLQQFAWVAEQAGSNVHAQANPTQGALMHASYTEAKRIKAETEKNFLISAYGVETSKLKLSKDPCFESSDEFVEYDRDGKRLVKFPDVKPRSKYVEDVLLHNHTAIWGSYWEDGKWGYACCDQTYKNAYCINSL